MFHYPSFKLDNFEGPLELLLYLIQKEEIDPCGVFLKQLTTQLIETIEKEVEVETSSEMMSLTASLMLLKSQRLLPTEEGQVEEIEENPRLELIQSLIEYCRFKDLAKALSEKEEEQRAYFPRAPHPFQKVLGHGLEEVDQNVLKSFLQEALRKADQQPQKIIQGETWQVADKLAFLREFFKKEKQLSFEALYTEKMGRLELIVTFLAMLEMMKYQEVTMSIEGTQLYLNRYE